MEDKLNIAYIDESMYDTLPNVSKNDYTVDDCVMVRTTDIFPKDRMVITPKNGGAYGFGRSVIFEEILRKKIANEYPDLDDDSFYEKLDEFNIFFDIPRGTIHYTINGLVSSHAYGNFDNKPFIIIESLKHHINDKSLVGLRVEDTYFNDNMKLSDEAIIMISKNYFDANKGNLEFIESLQGFNIIVFSGDETKAVEFVLRSLGYNAFAVNNHGYTNGFDGNNDETRMLLFLRGIAQAKSIPTERHCYSASYLEEKDSMIRCVEKREKEYLLYILDNSLIPDELRKRIVSAISDCNDIVYLSDNLYLEKLIDIIGLDNLKRLTDEYNNKCVKEIEDVNYSSIRTF